jgi:hypothetical protein
MRTRIAGKHDHPSVPSNCQIEQLLDFSGEPRVTRRLNAFGFSRERWWIHPADRTGIWTTFVERRVHRGQSQGRRCSANRSPEDPLGEEFSKTMREARDK